MTGTDSPLDGMNAYRMVQDQFQHQPNCYETIQGIAVMTVCVTKSVESHLMSLLGAYHVRIR